MYQTPLFLSLKGIHCTEDNQLINGAGGEPLTGEGDTRQYSDGSFNGIALKDVLGFNATLGGSSVWTQDITAGGWEVEPTFYPHYNVDQSTQVIWKTTTNN